MEYPLTIFLIEITRTTLVTVAHLIFRVYIKVHYMQVLYIQIIMEHPVAKLVIELAKTTHWQI